MSEMPVVFDPHARAPASLRDLKVTVMGLGLFGGGKGAIEFLCRLGARVTVTDLRTERTLGPAIDSLKHLPLKWVLGSHREKDFLEAGLVVPSPAVPRNNKLLLECRRRGIPLDTEMNLFFKYCRGRICAVTGSNGKTTTTSLLGAMAARRWPGIRIGGNLGKSLLPQVDSVRPDEWVILELSSFHLEDLASIERRPEIAVVTNLSPNHLDRHGTYEAYLDAKRVILDPAPAPNTAVLNAEDALVRAWARDGRNNVFFGRTGRPLPRAPGAWIREDGGKVVFSNGGSVTTLFASDDVPLRGRFNVQNATAAAAAAVVLGVSPEDIAAAVRGFQAVEHRLELVTEEDGIVYYNDSIATTPASTIEALKALGPRVVLICGGASKGASFRELGKQICRSTRAVVLIGQTAGEIGDAIPPHSGGPAVSGAGSLREAVRLARRLARSGDCVLLSPACASFDMFTNFVERGRLFKDLVLSGS